MYNVSVQANEPLPGEWEREIVRAVTTTLAREAAPEKTEVTVMLTDEEEIRRLNRDFRDADSATDVLSFEMNEPLPEGGVYLGDVIIALPVARRQAEAQGHTPLAELSLLAVHGVLHLLGEEHDSAEQKAAMWAKQSAILSELGLDATPTEQ